VATATAAIVLLTPAKKIFMSFDGDIFQANFFDQKNSINRQNNGDLEPLKGFGINFFRSNHPLIYLNLS
jgi:hypothetical protein